MLVTLSNDLDADEVACMVKLIARLRHEHETEWAAKQIWRRARFLVAACLFVLVSRLRSFICVFNMKFLRIE